MLRAAQNAIRARSVGSIILGEKEKPEVTRHVNDTSVTDICEIGGDFATNPWCGRFFSRYPRRDMASAMAGYREIPGDTRRYTWI